MTMTAEICISLWVLFNEAHITGMTTARAIKKYLLSTTEDVIMLVEMKDGQDLVLDHKKFMSW